MILSNDDSKAPVSAEQELLAFAEWCTRLIRLDVALDPVTALDDVVKRARVVVARAKGQK